jgi:WD40 repeat protein
LLVLGDSKGQVRTWAIDGDGDDGGYIDHKSIRALEPSFDRRAVLAGGHYSGVFCFCRTKGLLVTAGFDGAVLVWCLADENIVQVLRDPETHQDDGRVMSLRSSPRESFVVAGNTVTPFYNTVTPL